MIALIKPMFLEPKNELLGSKNREPRRLVAGFLFILLLLFSNIVLAQSAPDPIRIATGARPLGMGKAFVGLADEVGSIYLNPAGLANADRWQITSMSGKFLDEFNYMSLSGVYPTNYGKFGLALVGGTIGGALPTRVKAGSDPADPIYEVDPTQDVMNYYNNVFILSYGDKLKRLMEQPMLKAVNDAAPWLKELNFGGNIKIFRSGLSGDHIVQGSASGMEMDLGVQAKPLNWLSLGANLQNALPASLGGKLTYASGWTESYPAVLKMGAAVNVLGEDNALKNFGANELKLLLDADIEPTRMGKVPMVMHIGAEYTPIELLSLRAGIDQEMIGVGQTANNLAMGIGVNFRDFRFDYAYHQFAGAPGVDNHFFSLSYGVFKAKAKKAGTEMVKVYPDKVITFDKNAVIKGAVEGFQVARIGLNRVDIKINRGNTFEVAVPLKIGKNSFRFASFDVLGTTLEVDRSRWLCLVTYPDVPFNFWGYEQVGYIGTLGMIKGYPDGKFKPDGNITRAEMAALLSRTIAGSDDKVPAASREVFNDVKTKHWAVNYIDLAVKKAVVKGYPDRSFKPSSNITRAEGLAMIARFGSVPEIPYAGSEFTDLNAKHWAAPIIAGAFNQGMLVYFKGKPFQPNKKLTRAEAVEMLFRSRPVIKMIDELKNFEVGY